MNFVEFKTKVREIVREFEQTNRVKVDDIQINHIDTSTSGSTSYEIKDVAFKITDWWEE